MALELGTLRFSFLSLLAQSGNDDPPPSGMQRRLHWIGQKEPASAPEQGPAGKRSDGPPKKKDKRGYRQLSSITMGEVDEASKYFASQLSPAPYPEWIAPNLFSMIHLAPKREERPPAVFGRIQTCYPSDGHVKNVKELELLLPGKGHAPDLIHLRANDILHAPDQPAQSFYVRVRCLIHAEEMAEFSEQQGLFLPQGFMPEFGTSYIDLLDINEHNHHTLPWLYVISSRWFASIPVTIQPEIREKLTKLIYWNKLIFNYHPERLPREIRTLNRELGFKAGFTDFFLIEPEEPSQTVQIVSKTFDKLFNQPLPSA